MNDLVVIIPSWRVGGSFFFTSVVCGVFKGCFPWSKSSTFSTDLLARARPARVSCIPCFGLSFSSGYLWLPVP